MVQIDDPFIADLFVDLSDDQAALKKKADLYVDVKSYPPGTAITIPDPIVGGALTGPFVYFAPPPGSPNTVVVRVFYKWPLFVTGLGYNIANLNGSQRLLAASAAFHVEP